MCLDTYNEVPLLTPIVYPVSRSQSVSIPCFRVSTDQPRLIFSGSDGRGFRNSSTPLLLGFWGLTKIWEREILQGEEQGAACCITGPPSKTNPPHVAQTPHLFGLRRAWSNSSMYFLQVLVQNQLNLRSWGPGSAVACGALGSLPSGTCDPNSWVILRARI